MRIELDSLPPISSYATLDEARAANHADHAAITNAELRDYARLALQLGHVRADYSIDRTAMPAHATARLAAIEAAATARHEARENEIRAARSARVWA